MLLRTYSPRSDVGDSVAASLLIAFAHYFRHTTLLVSPGGPSVCSLGLPHRSGVWREEIALLVLIPFGQS